MNYIGSKYSLLPFLDTSIHSVIDKNCKVFCDLFAGTGVVGRYFKEKGFQVIANDLQHYSYVLNRHYIGNTKPLKFDALCSLIPALKTIDPPARMEWICNYLSKLKPLEGFIYRHYSAAGTANDAEQRMYFSDDNAAMCDAVRTQIEQWYIDAQINEDEYYFLLASLIESIDKVANTASVYGAYLKQLKPAAQKKFMLLPAQLFCSNEAQHVFWGDSNALIKNISCDILYLDPPYNKRQYAPNYHLLETISLYDAPNIKGKTGLRNYENQKSDYSKSNKVLNAFESLINNAHARYIFLSYNNEGLMDSSAIKSIMQNRGNYQLFTQQYNRFKADKDHLRNHKAAHTFEYLHFVEITR